jgi:hypothetical protein
MFQHTSSFSLSDLWQQLITRGHHHLPTRQRQNRYEARPALSITVMHQTNKYHQLYMTTQLYNMLAQSYNTQETKLYFEHYIIMRIIDNT